MTSPEIAPLATEPHRPVAEQIGSLITREQRINQILPEIDSQIFDTEPNAQYWVGQIANAETVYHPREYIAAKQLRANVYIDEMKFLPETERQASGGETDEYDGRSIHFAVLENMGPGQSPRIIGTSRLITKTQPGQKLPVEDLFPEAFSDGPASPESLETSRFIARHPDRRIQRATSLALMRAMDAYSLQHDNKPVYAIIEKPLMQLFRAIRLPFDTISEPKMIEEYNTVNQAIQINPADVIQEINPTAHQANLMASFFSNALKDSGLGYFDETFVHEEQ